MAEIIDILTLPPAKCMKFVVNTAVDFVALAEVAAPDYTLKNSNNKSTFLNGDNFGILSHGFILPESFTWWKDPAALPSAVFLLNQIAIKGLFGDIYKIDVLGTQAGIYTPMENFEESINVFVDLTKQTRTTAPHIALNENFTLFTNKTDLLSISMKGIPAALNGKALLVSPFFKILHNFSMI